MFKVRKGKTWALCWMCLKSTIKVPEPRQKYAILMYLVMEVDIRCQIFVALLSNTYQMFIANKKDSWRSLWHLHSIFNCQCSWLSSFAFHLRFQSRVIPREFLEIFWGVTQWNRDMFNFGEFFKSEIRFKKAYLPLVSVFIRWEDGEL